MSAIVVVIAAAALLIVLSGFGGLEKFSLSFASVFDPDLKVVPVTGKTFSVTPNQLDAISKIEGISAYSKIIEERVFLNFKQKNHIAYIKGVDANYGNVNPVDSIVGYGTWTLTDNTVVIGNGISNTLSLGIFNRNDALQIIVPKPGKGSITSQAKPYREAFVTATGIYQITEELDKKYVFTTFDLARDLTSIGDNEVSFLEIKTTKNADNDKIIEQLKTVFNNNIAVKNRKQLNDALYKMLNTENVAIYLIFTLVLIVALFNLAGAITMMILDKKDNLKTLYAVGITVPQLRNIFFLQGTLVTVGGGLLGILIGVILLIIQQNAPFVYIPPSLPYPVVIKISDILIVFSTISILGCSVSRMAANRISKKLLAK
ncbi:lipoprotein-releasing system permease protein [Pustulibacterium marinum]|uniref:Lipoprotein-releasing system permease protein n=1 Tax=Pustulibacterium marinum TaxID=1224947 RepID=A0A1I7EUC8_9FLAO|nr:FtsX-like permease family protein [Pustulibacterium marinum]SFU27498.1 lipoprotein-releasing system permease protein [Pustulibacterium marinum]